MFEGLAPVPLPGDLYQPLRCAFALPDLSAAPEVAISVPCTELPTSPGGGFYLFPEQGNLFLSEIPEIAAGLDFSGLFLRLSLTHGALQPDGQWLITTASAHGLASDSGSGRLVGVDADGLLLDVPCTRVSATELLVPGALGPGLFPAPVVLMAALTLTAADLYAGDAGLLALNFGPEPLRVRLAVRDPAAVHVVGV